jgi:uncharacterized protein (TIGR02453 family)
VTAAFAGFPRNAMGFWHELAATMSKDWFDANKQRYQTEWVEPMTALLGEVAAKVAPVYKPTKVGAPRVMRIYRDTRFSKDKSPYKTWIGGGVSLGGDQKPSEGVSVIYAHFGVGEDFIGGGLYVFDDVQIAKWRKRVADAKAGAALVKVVDKLNRDGYEVHASGAFARVPKPYPADHPRAELLKMRGIVVGFPDIPKGLIHKAALVDWIVGHAKAAAPLSKWLYANVA